MKILLQATWLLLGVLGCDAAVQILNIKFGGNETPNRVGPAAVGNGPDDYWNRYSRDGAQGGYLNFGVTPNLQWADRSGSGAGLIVENAPGYWGNGHPDRMFGDYLYAFNGRPITVTFTNLPVGTYTVYAYGHGGPPDVQNTEFLLTSAWRTHPPGRTTTRPGWLSQEWAEGVHYVKFSSVTVHAGYPLVVQSRPDAFPQAILNAIQIVRESDIPGTPVPSELPPPLPVPPLGSDFPGPLNPLPSLPPPVIDPRPQVDAGSADFPRRIPEKIDLQPRQLLNVQFGGDSVGVKSGPAAIGQGVFDFWNLYSRDLKGGGYRNNGGVSHFFWANGEYSGASLSVNNAAGWWGNGHADPMFGSYLYPLTEVNNGSMRLTVSNLPSGSYSILVYAHGGPPPRQNSEMELLLLDQSVGLGRTADSDDWLLPEWQPGRQYVHFSNVVVTANSSVVLISRPHSTPGVCAINGLQILRENGPADSVAVPPSQLVFDPPPGLFFLTPTMVTIRGAIWNSVVRYTLDGSEPVSNSPILEAAIPLLTTTAIRARAFAGDLPTGSEVSGIYTRGYLFADGIPSEWRARYFGTNYVTHAGAAAEADPDQDGSTNYQEFSAGSNPVDPTSGFLVNLRRVPSISWRSEPGRSYLIKRKDRLADANWVVIQEVVATGPFCRYTDEDVANTDSFYVVIPKP